MRDGWKATLLSEVITISRERIDPSCLEPDYELIHWSIPQLDETGGPSHETASEIGSHKFAVLKDSVVYSLLNPRIPRFAKIVGGKRVVCSTEFAVLQPDSSLSLDFLYFFVSSPNFQEQVRSLAKGTTKSRERIDNKEIGKLNFKLPPLADQKRIVDLISSVDSYIEALQHQLVSAKNSKSAYVNTIVSEIFAKGKKIKIADIAEVKGGKRLPKGTPWSEEPTDHRYIRATDIKDGIVLTANLVYVPDDVWPVISRYVVNQGDVVITIAGTIGQVGVIPASLDGVNLTENAAKIVVDRKLVRSNYLGMLLGSSYYQQDIDSKTKKTTQPKLGLNMINSIEIPLPELAEQDEIFSVVSQIDALITSTNDLIVQTITLRTGLLSDLLNGVHEIHASYDKVIGTA
jgi:type I restriction enzyme S subunit